MKKAFRIFRIVLLVVCAAVFAVSAVMLVDILFGYAKADSFYDDINNALETVEQGDTEVGKAPAHLIELSKYVSELKVQYPDVVGYVNVPSVGISYPVVQTDNNSYYLDHLINGDVSSSGSVFLDYRIDKNPQNSKNIVLYGHNMNDGSMFHKVETFFSDRSLFDGATVEYITEDGAFVYEPLALYRCEAYYPFHTHLFSSDESFLDFCDMISEKSFHSTSAEYDASTSLITFATCVNSITTKNARYIYQAVLKESYTNIHGDSAE